MNFVLGFVIFVFLAANTSITSNIIGSIAEDGAMFESGFFEEGDKIISFEADGKTHKIHGYNDIVLFGTVNTDADVNVTVLRDGRKITGAVVLKADGNGRLLFGFSPKILPNTPLNVIKAAADNSVYMVKTVALSLWWLVSGKVPVSSVSGPVGIVSEINSAVSQEGFLGFLRTLSLAGLISINLGVMNLLPLPALDGGRIVFVIAEKILGHRVSPDKEGLVHFIGFAILMAFMIFVTFSDIRKLFG